jgi:enoyl-CoA hydratase/carnithine racemase
MTDKAVLYRVEDTIGVITLNRPDNRNGMTPELLDAFAEAVASARSDPDLRCVVITGSGACFCSGADFKSTLQRSGDGRNTLPHERSFAMYEPFMSVLDIEVPVIGALNGHTVGGGLGLALMCDIRIGNREAKYGGNFARLGLHSGLGITYLLPRLIGISRAAELLFTGRKFLGDEAERLGLISEAVAPDEVMPRAMEMAAEIAATAPIAVRMMKRSMYRAIDWNVRGPAYEEAFAQVITIGTEDLKEGISALLEKRKPEFKGK